MFHLWRSGAIAGRIKDGVTLLGGVSCSSFFITMSFTKPRYESHKVILREEFANSWPVSSTNFNVSHILSWWIYSPIFKSCLSFGYFRHTMDLFLHSSCIITLCINSFAPLMYDDCLLVRRPVVRSYVTPQVETETLFHTLPDVIALCCVLGWEDFLWQGICLPGVWMSAVNDSWEVTL